MRAVSLAILLLSSGCTTLSGARPLAKGHHEVGVNFGGPLFSFGGPVPMPSVLVAGRSGLAEIGGRELDIGYGTNLTGLPFGIVSAYGDVGYLLVDPEPAGIPAVTLRNKLLFTSNFAAPNKATDLAPRGVWMADEIDVYLSWKVGGSLVHASVGQVFDFSNPGLLLVPGVGADIDFGKPGGFRLQPELRWWGINNAYTSRNLAWIPGTPGALGVHVGFVTPVGKNR